MELFWEIRKSFQPLTIFRSHLQVNCTIFICISVRLVVTFWWSRFGLVQKLKIFMESLGFKTYYFALVGNYFLLMETEISCKILYCNFSLGNCHPAGIYLFKINNGNTRLIWVIYSKLTIKRPEWSHWKILQNESQIKSDRNSPHEGLYISFLRK